jgi:hypothetical protein
MDSSCSFGGDAALLHFSWEEEAEGLLIHRHRHIRHIRLAPFSFTFSCWNAWMEKRGNGVIDGTRMEIYLK